MSEFEQILAKEWPELSEEKRGLIHRFRELVLDENERQNLTRITAPEDFYWGHVADVRTLLESGFLEYPALDVGSGVGVPGLLAALLDGQSWILSDSEGRKAEFLERAAKELGASSIQVYPGRAEKLLEKTKVGAIVARAVGPVERMIAWFDPCSTWNTLILFKGPAWNEEWAEFQASRFRKTLQIERQVEYTVGKEAKKRILVRLKRVPRGTKPR
ncbi:MAG: 16S rRNA (guanine(527)-N(7))-methyltransferase RsmG [Bdellovibrionota bacterium]